MKTKYYKLKLTWRQVKALDDFLTAQRGLPSGDLRGVWRKTGDITGRNERTTKWVLDLAKTPAERMPTVIWSGGKGSG